MAAAESSRRLGNSFVCSLSPCYVSDFALATKVRPIRALTALVEDLGSVLSAIHVLQLRGIRCFLASIGASSGYTHIHRSKDNRYQNQ